MSERVQQAVRDGLGGMILEMQVRSPRRIYVDVAPENFFAAAKCLFSDLGARYAIASGLQTDGGFEVLHHFAFDADHVVVSIRGKAGGDPPEFPSITPLIKGAEFIEREMHDLLGINFSGHPNMKRLILSDDWPEGVYPLRHGKPWEGKVRKQI